MPDLNANKNITGLNGKGYEYKSPLIWPCSSFSDADVTNVTAGKIIDFEVVFRNVLRQIQF